MPTCPLGYPRVKLQYCIEKIAVRQLIGDDNFNFGNSEGNDVEMAGDPDPLDDLPKHDPNHVTEEKAETAFQERLTESGYFILQRAV